jgi:2-polyprenyl-6-methoxyphenol hydroxylase-like FAD-dependent oxidoreductase
MRVPQVEIEPVLKHHIENSPLVDTLFGMEFLDLRQDADGATATLRDVRSGATEDIRTDYLAGCDGESSKVRHCLGIALSGEARTMLLDAYERERRPVALRNCGAARRHNDVRVRIAELYTPELFAQGEASQQARQLASQLISAIGNAENESEGIEWGYAYTNSPIVAYEPGDQ